MIFSYSDISGAIFNPAISLALWLTGKLSNRKLILYVVFQLLGGFTALFIIFCSFDNSSSDLYKNLLRKPVGNDTGRIFASEFFAMFILTYTVFVIILEDAESQKKEVKTFKYADGITVYSTKGGKNAFAPFVFGFALFGLINIGGCSGQAMNPVVVLVPALVTFRFEHVWIYLTAEFAGSCAAAAIVHLQHIKVDEKLERSTILGDDIKDDLGSPLLT
jgi:aquaporin Z